MAIFANPRLMIREGRTCVLEVFAGGADHWQKPWQGKGSNFGSWTLEMGSRPSEEQATPVCGHVRRGSFSGFFSSNLFYLFR